MSPFHSVILFSDYCAPDNKREVPCRSRPVMSSIVFFAVGYWDVGWYGCQAATPPFRGWGVFNISLSSMKKRLIVAIRPPRARSPHTIKTLWVYVHRLCVPGRSRACLISRGLGACTSLQTAFSCLRMISRIRSCAMSRQASISASVNC